MDFPSVINTSDDKDPVEAAVGSDSPDERAIENRDDIPPQHPRSILLQDGTHQMTRILLTELLVMKEPW